jgi:hypothetical protein
MNEITNMVVKYCLHPDKNTSLKVNKKYYITKSSTYLIFNYDKRYMSFDDINNGLYRSVIFSYPEKNIVCFSPPKSIPFTLFINKYPVVNDSIIVKEKIEGVMISLFYDNRINQWDIATKSSIGGKSWFYGKKNTNSTSFLKMFLDVFREPGNKRINDIAYLENLSKEHCYNFIMQHPDNSIFIKVNEPALFLISVYKIIGNEIEYISPTIYEAWSVFSNIRGIINFPKNYEVTDYYHVMSEKSWFQNKIDCPGFMIINTETGDRTHVESKRYKDAKTLLTVNPSIQYQYLCMHRLGKANLEEFIAYFPRMKSDFYKLRYQYDSFVMNVYKAYITKYIDKTDDIILDKYISHIYKLHHTIYLPSLTVKKPVYINKKIVNEYFNKMEPRELLYLLNWDLR